MKKLIQKNFLQKTRFFLFLLALIFFYPSCKKDYHCSCVTLTTIKQPTRTDTFSTRTITTYKDINSNRARTLCTDKSTSTPQGANTRIEDVDCVMSEAD